MIIQSVSRTIACLAVVLTGGFFAGLFDTTAIANPNGKQPQRPMAAHGTIPAAKTMVDELYKIAEEEEAFLRDTHEKKDNLTRVSDKLIAKAAGRVWKARRDVEHLKLMAEPAAEDLHRRFFLLAVELDKVGLGYSGTPKGQQLVQRIRTRLQREKPKLLRFLQQAQPVV